MYVIKLSSWCVIMIMGAIGRALSGALTAIGGPLGKSQAETGQTVCTQPCSLQCGASPQPQIVECDGGKERFWFIY